MDVTIQDYRRTAKRHVPKAFFDYMDSGSWTEQTMHSNHAELQKILFRQRVALDISERKLNTQMVGQDVRIPVALAPVGFTGMQYARGEVLAAQAAEEFGVPFTLSTMSICSIEEVAEHTTKPFWFQLYFMKDLDFMRDLLRRASEAKCSALVVTLDLQMEGDRFSDYYDGFRGSSIWPGVGSFANIFLHPFWGVRMLAGGQMTFGNIIGHQKDIKHLTQVAGWIDKEFDLKLSDEQLKWIRKHWDAKIIFKGILTREDAERAVKMGADAIIVSNHGGRQLDGAPATIQVLPQIVDAVGDKVEVFMDSGIRSGQDVMRAIAMGAKGTFIGRAYQYGLGAKGKQGVTDVLNLFENAMDKTMAFCGETDIKNFGRHNLWSREHWEKTLEMA